MLSKADPNMPYGTRSGVSRAGREVKMNADDFVAGLNDFAFYEKRLQEIEKPIDFPTEKTRTLPTGRGPIFHFGITSSVTCNYKANGSNESSEANQKDDSIKSDAINKSASHVDANETTEGAEQTDKDLNAAIFASVNDLLARVNATLTKEERCWYELEAPHCRNRRLPFILRSELDVLDTVKNREIKEMYEALTEVASHYKNTLAREKTLKEENNELKARLESNTNVLLGSSGYGYPSDVKSYSDVMAGA